MKDKLQKVGTIQVISARKIGEVTNAPYVPIEFAKLESGAFVIVSGALRLEYLKRSGVTTFPAIVTIDNKRNWYQIEVKDYYELQALD